MTSRARQTPLARCFSVVHWFEHLLPPKLPADSLRAVEMVVLLLPTQILPSYRRTERQELLRGCPRQLVRLLRLSPEALLFAVLELLPPARPAEARCLLPELVRVSLPELPPDLLRALETAVLLL